MQKQGELLAIFVPGPNEYKVALAHGAHAIDSGDVSELIQELEKLLAEREADFVRLEWLAMNSVEARNIFLHIHPGQEKFLRSEIDYRMQQHAAQGGVL